MEFDGKKLDEGGARHMYVGAWCWHFNLDHVTRATWTFSREIR